MSTSFVKKYKVLLKIGEGSFSEVLKCQDRETGSLYAAKRLKKIYQNMSEILESPEVIAMRKISRHSNILYMVESHYDPLPGKVTLIFELMDMSLYDLMKARKGRALTEQRVKIYFYQLLKGLEHLHKHGIFHRDIKPENILLKGDVVKLADLGSIRGIYSRPPYTEYISTRWYRSPECLLTTGFYGPKMDVWATGCVFYELLTLKPLFPGANEVDQITKIHGILGTPHARLVAKFRRHSKSRNCEYFFPTKGGTGVGNLLPQVSDAGRDVLKLMLVYDPENRSNVKRLLEHRYFGDLRENESPRHSTTVTPSPSIHEGGNPLHWRNPVLLSYITSERRRKLKVRVARLNFFKQCKETNFQPPGAAPIRKPKLIELQMVPTDLNPVEAIKMPRIVASSPNYTRQTPSSHFYNKSGPTKMSKSDKSNACDDDPKDNKKKLSRAWGTPNFCPRKRENASKIGERISKDNASDISDISVSKLPSIKRSSKSIVSRENSTSPMDFRTIPMKRGPSTLGTQYDFCPQIIFDDEQKLHFEHKRRESSSEKSDGVKSFLPMITSRKPEVLVHRGSGGASGGTAQPCEANISLNRRQKTRLATITERATPVDPTTRAQKTLKNHCYELNESPVAAVKSPAKKIAKHETATAISPTSSTVIPSKKIKPSPKKLFDKRERFGNIKY